MAVCLCMIFSSLSSSVTLYGFAAMKKAEYVVFRWLFDIVQCDGHSRFLFLLFCFAFLTVICFAQCSCAKLSGNIHIA